MKSNEAVANGRAGRIAVAALIILADLLWAAPVRAIFPARYVACHEQRPLPPKAAAKPNVLLPLPRRRAPKKLKISPLLVIDVATVEPIPASDVAPPPPTRLAAVREGRNDYRCIGIPRGTAGILRVVGAAPGTRFFGHTHAESWRRTNMIAAGLFALRESTPGLRRELARSLPAGIEDHRLVDHLQGKVAASNALADLGDSASAKAMRAFIRAREREPYPLIWRDTVRALARIDAGVAQSYAIEALHRVADQPKLGTREKAIVRAALPLLTVGTAKALAPLRQLSARMVEPDGDPDGWHACLVLGARARLGDAPLLAELRPELAVDLRTQRGVLCYSQLIAATFPGRDPDEVDVLMHRHRYEQILDLLLTMRRAEQRGDEDSRFDAARRKLKAWLNMRSGSPDVSGDKTLRANNPTKRALHLTALAFLGDRHAKAKLDALIIDPNDNRTAPWVAAYQALRLDLDGAADNAVARMRLAIKATTQRFSTESRPRRGVVLVTEHVRVIDELVKRGDPRFALGLLDRNVFARTASAAHLARQRPKRACEIVGAAAKEALDNPIQDAFWALSVLGDGCRATMRKLAEDRSQPSEVRGMALEVLAMMRDKTVAGHLERGASQGKLRGSRRRARIIFNSSP